MTGYRRALALAAALNTVALVGGAAAQTVVVTKAPAGAALELVLNGASIASATASPSGEATLLVNMQERGGRTEMDTRIYLDTCPDARRIVLVERGLEPPAASGGCARKELISLFLMRPATTLVVDASDSNPDVWLRQGPAPSAWLTTAPSRETEHAGRVWRPAPGGLVAFAGGGLAGSSMTENNACGNVTDCGGNSRRNAFSAGAVYWIGPFLGVQGSYLQPADLIVTGAAYGYRFTSSLNSHITTIAGTAGASVGPVRFYGQAGTTYQRSTFSTTETIDDLILTVDGVSQTVPGGTQTLVFRTGGWGWMYGGGAEFWLRPRFAAYAEAGRIAMKGSDLDLGEAKMDDTLTYLQFGLRFAVRR